MVAWFASVLFMYYRAIHVSEVMEEKLVSTRVVMVRFVEAEASVSVILEKLKIRKCNACNIIRLSGHHCPPLTQAYFLFRPLGCHV